MNREEGYTLFTQYLDSLNYTERTKHDYLREVKAFYYFLKLTFNITDVRDVKFEHLKSYIDYLKNRGIEKENKPYSSHTIYIKAIAIKNYFKCFYLYEKILINPFENFKLKDKGSKVRPILSEDEIGKVLDSIKTDSLKGKRNRAVFELLYSSGLRCNEVSKLKVEDVDLKGRYVMIRGGKFGKDRMVPVSKVASKFMESYGGGRGEYFFEGDYGGCVSTRTIHKTFKDILKLCGYGDKGISVHSLRHMMATHLLEHGVSVRHVQEMLGHESVETTVKYTHMMKSNMKKLYKKHHPRENEMYAEADKEYERRLNYLLDCLKSKRKI